MKKTIILGLAVVSALAFVSCKSSESSYKKAYEKARAQEQVQQQVTEPVQVTPVVAPVVAPVAQEDHSDLRSERLQAVGDGTLKAFNVVCGSFQSLTNANNLCATLKSKGYAAVVAQNPETRMYRVVAVSSDTRSAAVSERDRLRASYPDAWILYRAY